MSSTSVVVIIVVLVVLVIAGIAAWTWQRRRAGLRERFGPEYDRVVSEKDSSFAADRELRERERRHAELELRPLSPESRQRYSAAWEEVQARFVDAPKEAVGQADELITRLIAERGYPTSDFDEQVAHLSVDHARTLDYYRKAHDIHVSNERGEATTEQLRQALVYYRSLFGDLLDSPQTPASETQARVADNGRVPDGGGVPDDARIPDEDEAEARVPSDRTD
jgi:hypothetical protein